MKLSYAEELLWQAEMGDPRALPFFDCAQSLCLVLHLQGPLNKDALRMSLEAIVRRHEVLRSRFVSPEERPIKSISRRASIRLMNIEGQTLAGEDPREIVRKVVTPLLKRRFDVTHDPPMRVVLAGLSSHEHILAIAVHHIVCDLWSMHLLELELKRFYDGYITGQAPALTPLTVRYRDYVSRQEQLLKSERGRILRDYWTERLKCLPDLRAALTGNSEESISTRSGSSWFAIPPEEAGCLAVLSRKYRSTFATTMLAIFILFLYKLSGADDIAVGVPLSDRRRPEFEHLIGLFMNVVVVRTTILRSTTFIDLLSSIRRNLVEACLHQDLPYGHLLRVIPTRPPYRVIFNFMPSLPKSDFRLDTIQTTRLPLPMEARSFADLSLNVHFDSGALLCRLLYKADLFSENCGSNFARQIRALTAAVLAKPQDGLSCYCLQ